MPSVLFVAPSAYTLSGLATWLDYLLPGLRSVGWDARLGLVSGPVHHRPAAYLKVHPEARVHVAHCATGTREGRLRALDRMLGVVGPDIAVSVNTPDLFGAIDRRRRKGRHSPRTVLSVHGIEAFLYAEAARHSEVLDAVVCTNRLACELAAELGGVESGRLLYAPYGVALPDEVSPRRPADCLRIVYSGRLESAQKRVADLVGIVEGLHQLGVPFRLEIAGDGPERAALEREFAKDILSGCVLLHGQLPIEQLKAGPYAQADVLLITSSWETGPIVAWEAMAQGLPVVSSRYVGSGREGALEDGKNALLFEIGDAPAAARALARLWGEPELRAALAEAGRRLVAQRYAIPVSVAHWGQVLQAVLAQPAREAARGPLPSCPAGRLDRLIGPAMAETLRGWLSRSAPAAPDPGGEWPHSLASTPSDEAFWHRARSADIRSAPAPISTEPAHVE